MRGGSGGGGGSGLVLLLLLLAAQLHDGACVDARQGVRRAEEESDDEESDSAPFMVLVETEGGQWRCAGALVSLRTAVSSAWCARGGGMHADKLWALTAAAASGQAARRDGARRVARVAVAGTSEQRGGGGWGGALLDLAVLELEAPFGSGARARPILMATAPSECAAPAECHVVRAQWRSGARAARLRIVDASLVSEATCAPLVPYWSLARERALCVSGPELCRSDWGAGVVCGGKLCGVVSRSMRADAPAQTEHVQRAMPQCGRVTLAQSVPRWRRFLHCAHTLRACGRDTCADLCIEHQLLDMELLYGATPDVTVVYTDPLSSLRPHTAGAPSALSASSSPAAPTRTAPLAPPPPVPVSAFEPNRPDFTGSPPRRSTLRVTPRPGWLKAGEYGDNVADYGGGGGDDAYTATTPPSSSVPTRSHTPAPHRHAPVAPRQQAAPRAGGRGRSRADRTCCKTLVLSIWYLLLQLTFL